MREGPSAKEIAAATRIVMLGTGTPIPDAYRAGPSIAVVHKGNAYLFDVGAGAIRNAALARYKYDIPSLYPTHICCVFLTHLHSDHMLDFSELAYTMWWRRPLPLRAWGPPGLQEMTDGMRAMMAPDTRSRRSGTQPVLIEGSYFVEATEILPGFVFEKDGLRIEAFEVNHGDIKPAYGYRITTDDKTIVISGDTAISQTLEEMAEGADILFHEVISDSGLLRNSEAFQAYHRRSHSQATDLGRLASRVRPGLLVLYHGLYYGLPETTVLDEVRSTYDGKVMLANDLDTF
jgi:ribonuclease BN (tRNA processing enzyme)